MSINIARWKSFALQAVVAARRGESKESWWFIVLPLNLLFARRSPQRRHCAVRGAGRHEPPGIDRFFAVQPACSQG
jgi:hypothetical protein